MAEMGIILAGMVFSGLGVKMVGKGAGWDLNFGKSGNSTYMNSSTQAYCLLAHAVRL